MEPHWWVRSTCKLCLLKYMPLIFHPRPKSENPVCDSITYINGKDFDLRNGLIKSYQQGIADILMLNVNNSKHKNAFWFSWLILSTATLNKTYCFITPLIATTLGSTSSWWRSHASRWCVGYFVTYSCNESKMRYGGCMSGPRRIAQTRSLCYSCKWGNVCHEY